MKTDEGDDSGRFSGRATRVPGAGAVGNGATMVFAFAATIRMRTSSTRMTKSWPDAGGTGLGRPLPAVVVPTGGGAGFAPRTKARPMTSAMAFAS